MNLEPQKNYNRIVVNSDDRNVGTSSQFRIQLNYRIDRMTSIQLVSAIIPNTLYVFSPERNNQTITLHETGYSNVDVVIPPGSYDITYLCTLLGNLLTASSPSTSTYTVSYDQYTNKLTFNTSGPQFQFLFSTGNINNPYVELGFVYDTDTTLTTSLTAPNCFNLSGVPYVLLKLSNLQHNIVNTRNVSANFKINMESQFGYVQYYTPQTVLENFHYIPEQTITYLDVTISDDNGVPVNLNGAEISFTLTYTTAE